MSPLFFVHIPKTAGTSFRSAAVKYFGSRKVLRDYGSKAAETSDLVQQYAYRTKDYWSIYRELETADIKLVCGHVSAKKYVPGLGAANTVVFLRDPLQRIYSEFQHFVRHNNYRGSFRDFYDRPGMINNQSRFLDTVPLASIGVVGITERYDESLAVINQRYGIDLKPREENTGRASVEQPHEIDADDYQRLSTLNRNDIQLYKRACALFDQRSQLLQDGLTYVHAELTLAGTKKVSGWAWWSRETEGPVSIHIRVNGEVVATAVAQEHRPKLAYLSLPRGGYVGFSARVRIKAGDRLDCVVAETGQVFPASPKVIKA